jgi:hypothetical protein
VRKSNLAARLIGLLFPLIQATFCAKKKGFFRAVHRALSFRYQSEA